jgi:hypothetical protein
LRETEGVRGRCSSGLNTGEKRNEQSGKTKAHCHKRSSESSSRCRS